MSFTCGAHGWRHGQSPCPQCETTDKAQGMGSWSLDIILKNGLGDFAIDGGLPTVNLPFNIEEACRQLDETYQAAVERADNYLLEAEQAFDRIMALKQELTAEKLRSGKLVEACKIFVSYDGTDWPGDDAVVNLAIAIAAYEKGEL